MPEQKMKITEEAFSDFTGHMCRAGFSNSISDEPLTERQQSQLSACLQAVPLSQSVNITPASPSVLVGKTVQLSAGISMGKSASSFTWKSANDQIAAVNGTGLVTGVAPGKVKITATDQETQLSASVEVTVNPVAVQSVTVTPDSTSVEKGKSVSLKANVQPSNATNKAVTWSSKNEDKATVDQSGNVTGVEVGTATIEIVSQDGSKKATATVEVTAPVVAVTGVEIDPNSTTVEANKTVQLTANVEPAGATNKTVTWESKNTEFATVDSETGVVTGVAAGTATIEV
ncbi:Ig-like domain-containing protein, partial [Escherichia coli]|uniref:Ig-like domain-containing protein n=1 Tax=Escherichia coli TaxID=562 RepID=UPI000E0E252C